MAGLSSPVAAPPDAKNSRSVPRGNRIPGFPKSVRLLRSGDFRKVYDTGTRYTCPLFAAFCLAARDQAGPRIGFTTPRALGKAVTRNRIRRRMREAVRLELDSLNSEWSIVFNPRRKLLDCMFPDIELEVRRLFERCNQRSALSLQGSSSPINV